MTSSLSNFLLWQSRRLGWNCKMRIYTMHISTLLKRDKLASLTVTVSVFLYIDIICRDLSYFVRAPFRLSRTMLYTLQNFGAKGLSQCAYVSFATYFESKGKKINWSIKKFCLKWILKFQGPSQRYTYRVSIKMKLILLSVWAERPIFWEVLKLL